MLSNTFLPEWLVVLALILFPLLVEAQIRTFGTVHQYNGHWYALSNVADGWTELAAESNAAHGYMVVINNANEQSFVNTTFVAGTARPLWIGLKRTCHGCTSWVWHDGSSLGYTSWKSGEPSNSGGVEDYVAMNWIDHTGGFHGQWNDCPLNGSRGYAGGDTDGPYQAVWEFNTDPTACNNCLQNGINTCTQSGYTCLCNTCTRSCATTCACSQGETCDTLSDGCTLCRVTPPSDSSSSGLSGGGIGGIIGGIIVVVIVVGCVVWKKQSK